MQRFDDDDLDEAREDVGFLVRNLLHSQCTLAHAGRYCEAIVEAQRSVALLELLLHADAAVFADELAVGAYARRHFLRRCAKSSFADHYTCASRADGLFAALAAGQLGLAREIGALSPAGPRANEEYEEDFWYARFLFAMLEPLAPAPVLKELERSLEGEGSARLDVCKALAARDPAALDEALEALLEVHAEDVANERLGPAQEEAGRAAATHVFVEGLALLQLAGHLGIETRAEYPFCPAIARVPRDRPAPADELPEVTP